MTRRLTVILVVLLVVGCAGTDQEAPMNAEEIQIPLGGDPGEVAGHDWPTRDDGSRLDATAIEREHTAVLTSDGSEILRSDSQLTFLREHDDVVEQVTLTPLVDAGQLDDVIDAAEALLDGHDLLDDNARDDLAEFRGHTEDTQQWPAGRSTLRTSTRGSNVEVHVEIRPTGQDDWFYSLTVVPVR